MNHFMLPLDASQGTSAWGAAVSAATRYGNVAMERLINDILKLGGRRENLEIKLVGGGRVLAAMTTDIGARNIDFVRQYVQRRRIQGASAKTWATSTPRKVVYFPETGRIRVQQAHRAAKDPVAGGCASATTSTNSTASRIGGDVELF